MTRTTLHIDDCPIDTPVTLIVNNQALCIVRTPESIYAVADACPHRGISLSGGLYRDGCVTCPGHFWRFDLASGLRQGDSTVRTITYAITIDDEGWLHAEVPHYQEPKTMREVLLDQAMQGPVRDDLSSRHT